MTYQDNKKHEDYHNCDYGRSAYFSFLPDIIVRLITPLMQIQPLIYQK
ncbi:5645_t:CDS:1, partial [Dentiscutata erythropus]